MNNGDFEITASTGAGFDITDYSDVYDSVSHSITVNNTVAGDTVNYSVDGGLTWSTTNPGYTNVGTYTVDVKVTNPNYAYRTGKGTVTITARPIEITAASDSKVYDRTALTNDDYSITTGLLAGSETITSVTVTGTQTEVGISANVPSDAVITDAEKNDVTSNYDITYVDGTLEIVNIDIRYLDYTIEYYKDGEAEPFETINSSVSTLDPKVNEVSYANKPSGYVLDAESSTKIPFTVEVDSNNVIKVYYVKVEEPVEGIDYVVINWMYETGYNTNNYDLRYNYTHDGTVKDVNYYVNQHYDSGYTFSNSNVVSTEEIVIIGEVTSGSAVTGTAIKTVVTLNYDRNGSSRPDRPNPPVIIEDPEVPLAELEKLDHFAYVIGYVEGDVRPLNNITREEVAMIFYRLLTDESRNELLSDSNPFTDIDSSRWSNIAISTLYNGGILKGYLDGEFKPSDPISRAEFAAISARFDKLEPISESKLTDISGHWAEKYINSSELKGWIKGYEDNTFRPEIDITRAEAMTLINNVLGRGVTEENIHPDAIKWPDNLTTAWYYEAVEEATNSHDYLRDEKNLELWTGMKANKVWP